MDQPKKYFVKRMLSIFAGGLCAALVLAREFAVGVVSTMGLTICLIVLCILVTVAVAFSLKKETKIIYAETRIATSVARNEPSRIDIQKKAQRLKIWIVVVNLLLVYGLWVNGSQVSLPLIVGVLISLSITAGLISILLRLRQMNK